MQVSLETTSTIGRRLTVKIPNDRVQSEIAAKTNELNRTAKIPGFRPGKIPANIIQQKYGAQIQQEAIGKVIENSLPLALEECKLQPAGRPVVEKIQNEPGQTFEYVVSFEIFPEIHLPDVSKIEIDSYQTDLAENEITEAIEKLQKQFGTWKKTERPAKMEDRVIVNYHSTLNGKAYKDNSGDNIPVELGSKLFIEGFETGLVGAKAGDKLKLNLTFPTDWTFEKLAGQTAEFNIEVVSVMERHVAELDKTFAKKINAKGETIDAIRQKVREGLEKNIENAVLELHKQQIFNALLKDTKVELPKALVDHEMALLHEDLHRQQGEHNHTNCGHDTKALEGQAKRRVALSLILRRITEAEKIVIDKDRVKQKIQSLAKAYQDPKQVEEMYAESRELAANVHNNVIVEQIVEHLMKKVKCHPKVVSMEGLFKTQY